MNTYSCKGLLTGVQYSVHCVLYGYSRVVTVLSACSYTCLKNSVSSVEVTCLHNLSTSTTSFRILSNLLQQCRFSCWFAQNLATLHFCLSRRLQGGRGVRNTYFYRSILLWSVENLSHESPENFWITLFCQKYLFKGNGTRDFNRLKVVWFDSS